MKREETSEEKLLNLIRQKDKSGGIIAQERKNTDSPKIQRPSRLKGFRFLEFCSIVLIAISLGCVAYIVSNYYLFDQQDESIRSLPDMELTDGDAINKKTILPETKPFSVYEKRLQQRNIFEMVASKRSPKSGVIKRSLDDLSKKIRIVGIVIDQDSKVIIEDIKTKQTVIVSEGERIGDALLEKIQDDRVIFDYHDKKVELIP